MDVSAIETALTTGFTSVQSNVLSFATTAIPIAIAIAGLFIAVRLGIKFFKSVAK